MKEHSLETNDRDPQDTPEITTVGDVRYNAELIEPYAEAIEAQWVPLENLKEAVGEGHYYWDDKKGEKLGPHQILTDWEAAQRNSDWAEHVANIQQADLNNPIWMTRDGIVFNGMHRLTRAFLDNVPTIKVRIFNELPQEAIIQDLSN